MTFTIERLTPANLVELADAFAPAPYLKERAQYERYFAEQEAGTRVTLLARSDDRDGVLAGYTNLLWHSDHVPFARAGVPEINDLNVLLPWRRRGVATRLILAAEEIARGAGHTRVGVGAGVTPDYAAGRALYPKLGYTWDGDGVYETAYGAAEYLTKALEPDEPPR